MQKRNNIEISKELRIKMIIPILEGKDIVKISKELDISVKTLKARLTLLYKYYNVKNRIELMALYTNVPTPFYRFVKGIKYKRSETKISKVTYRDAQEKSKEMDILPIGVIK